MYYYFETTESGCGALYDDFSLNRWCKLGTEYYTHGERVTATAISGTGRLADSYQGQLQADHKTKEFLSIIPKTLWPL